MRKTMTRIYQKRKNLKTIRDKRRKVEEERGELIIRATEAAIGNGEG